MPGGKVDANVVPVVCLRSSESVCLCVFTRMWSYIVIYEIQYKYAYTQTMTVKCRTVTFKLRYPLGVGTQYVFCDGIRQWDGNI